MNRGLWRRRRRQRRKRRAAAVRIPVAVHRVTSRVCAGVASVVRPCTHIAHDGDTQQGVIARREKKAMTRHAFAPDDTLKGDGADTGGFV